MSINYGDKFREIWESHELNCDVPDHAELAYLLRHFGLDISWQATNYEEWKHSLFHLVELCDKMLLVDEDMILASKLDLLLQTKDIVLSLRSCIFGFLFQERGITDYAKLVAFTKICAAFRRLLSSPIVIEKRLYHSLRVLLARMQKLLVI